jgi:hypothetical protein
MVDGQHYTTFRSLVVVLADIAKYPIAVRVPYRPFGKDKTRGKAFRLRGFHDIGEGGDHKHLLLRCDRSRPLQKRGQDPSANPSNRITTVPCGSLSDALGLPPAHTLV